MNDQGQIRAMIPVKLGFITWDHILHEGVVEPKMRTLVDFQIYGDAGAAWGY